MTPETAEPVGSARRPAAAVEAVRAELAAVFASAPLGSDAPASFRVLWERLRQQTEGGKLLRPRLVDLGHRTVRGVVTSVSSTDARASDTPARPPAAEAVAVARLGAAFELLHAALIVHDDVIDRDVLRRGRPTLAEVYRAEAADAGAPAGEDVHLGRSVGVIAGDVLLTEAFRLAVTCHPDPARGAAVAPGVFRAATASAAGELEDVLLALHRREGVHPDPARILTMDRLKTAAYTFEEPLRAGALLAGAPAAHADGLAEAGAMLGVAYQVVDDVLGLTGDPARTGKPADADLREGKATVLTAHGRRDPDVCEALARVDRAERAGDDLDELSAAVHAARDALVAAGSVDHAIDVAADLVDGARALLDGLDMPSAERAEFAATCHHILHREA